MATCAGPAAKQTGAPRTPMRDASKARGVEHTGVFERRATPLAAMQRWPNALVISRRALNTSGFNAEALGVVQVGGLWTPMPFRGRGYGRAVVAGSLLDRRAAGATRSVLFTGPDDFAAQRVYLSLGYRHTGEYGMWLFA